MSQKQQHHEALRWLTTAKEDFAAATVLKEQRMYSHSCFFSAAMCRKGVESVVAEIG